jgi:hypothetical protein
MGRGDRLLAQSARRRLGEPRDVEVVNTTFEHLDPEPRRFDLVTFVASPHHTDLHSGPRWHRKTSLIGAAVAKTARGTR